MPRTSRRTRQRVASTHRSLGLIASVIVLMLALTGLLLNHAGELESLEEPVRSELLLDWYGLAPEGEPQSFRVGDAWVVGLEQRAYLDARAIATIDSKLIGALGLGPLLVLATSESLLLFTNDEAAAAVDRLGPASLPGRLERIGVGSKGRLLVDTGGDLFRADEELLEWQPAPEAAGARWSLPLPPPDAARDAVLASHRGEGLTRFRVVSDLHSGRILGEYGFLLMDGAALVLLLLTGSGIYNWLVTRKPRSPAVAEEAIAGREATPPSVRVGAVEGSESS